MHNARFCLALILTLALALVGAGAAPVAGSAGLTELVICAEDGPARILLDDQGRPAPLSERCCTCIACAALHGYVPPAAPLATPARLARRADPARPACVTPWLRAQRTAWPRAPPLPPASARFFVTGSATLEFGQESSRGGMASNGRIQEVAR